MLTVVNLMCKIFYMDEMIKKDGTGKRPGTAVKQ